MAATLRVGMSTIAEGSPPGSVGAGEADPLNGEVRVAKLPAAAPRALQKKPHSLKFGRKTLPFGLRLSPANEKLAKKGVQPCTCERWSRVVVTQTFRFVIPQLFFCGWITLLALVCFNTDPAGTTYANGAAPLRVTVGPGCEYAPAPPPASPQELAACPVSNAPPGPVGPKIVPGTYREVLVPEMSNGDQVRPPLCISVRLWLVC